MPRAPALRAAALLLLLAAAPLARASFGEPRPAESPEALAAEVDPEEELEALSDAGAAAEPPAAPGANGTGATPAPSAAAEPAAAPFKPTQVRAALAAIPPRCCLAGPPANASLPPSSARAKPRPPLSAHGRPSHPPPCRRSP
jgi:hypothetical protein